MRTDPRVRAVLRALWYFAVLTAILLVHDVHESPFRYWRM